MISKYLFKSSIGYYKKIIYPFILFVQKNAADLAQNICIKYLYFHYTNKPLYEYILQWCIHSCIENILAAT